MHDSPTTPPEPDPGHARSLVADLEGIVWEVEAATMLFTFVSDGAAGLLGWTPNEWLDSPGFWAAHLHPHDRSRVVDRFVAVATAGGAFDEEYRFQAKDGTWVWVRDRGHAVHDEQGTPATLRGLVTDISVRKRLEKEWIDAEDRFERVVERLPAIVYLEAIEHDPRLPGRMLYVSPQVEPIMGFTPEEWIADPVAWSRQFHPDDRERARKEYERVAAREEPFRSEYRMHTRSGEVVWFRDEAILVRDRAGEPLYWQGVMLDITAQRATEELAQDTEGRYLALIEQLPAIVYSEDVAGSGLQLVYINSRVEALLGITPQEWLADPGVWAQAIHDDDRGAVLAENERTERTGEPFSVEYRMMARDGRVIWFKDEAVLVRDDAGEPRFWQGVMIDITARREAESQLAEAEARYRALVEQNPTITYIDPIEKGESTRYISPQTTAILGYEPQEWYADPQLWSKLVHPDDRARLESEGSEPGSHTSTYRLIAKDGREVWIHDQARLIIDEEGNPRFWQGVLVDVTQQRRADKLQHDLERARLESDRLRIEDEMKTTFLQAVSHDLRTPIAAILGLSVTLERGDVELTGDEARDIAGRIANNALRLERIVSGFLDLEKLNRGLAQPCYEPMDIGGLVREHVANSDPVVKHRVTLDVESLRIRADPRMVERILENLVGNTVKHTPGDSRIWARVVHEDDGALLVVEDDGPGVPVGERERIFDPFRQGSSSAPGSGLGLALVARFAALHGGRAWVEDRVGGGASFNVWLPSDPPAQLPIRADEVPSAADPPAVTGHA